MTDLNYQHRYYVISHLNLHVLVACDQFVVCGRVEVLVSFPKKKIKPDKLNTNL